MATTKSPAAIRIWMSPEGALVLLAAIVTAAAASMPLVLLPGALAYAIVTLLRLARARGGEREDLAPIEPDVARLAPAYAARVLRASALQRAILSELEGAVPEHGALLAGTAERARALAAASARLAEQLQDLDRHLAEAARLRAGSDARALEQQIAAAQDPAAREGYARALAQERQKERVFGELSARRERIDAQLVEIEKTLETASAQVMRIRSAEGAAAGAEGARIAESLDALAVEVDAAAETVDEAAAGEVFARR